ncbi:MAG: SDR family NAD(P)-dependent oxidoreductase [Acidobacteriia bacterium]|nr:SDR family NAD(P)-dependent oxidoreductase [Terriglobia bacterium]
MPMRTEQVALITGAGGGLGTVVTAAFLEAGLRVAGLSRRWKNAPEHERFFALEGDLASADAAEMVVRGTLAHWGRLDAVVHLAGGYASGGTLEQTPDQVWDEMLEVNLRTAVRLMRAAAPVMQRAGQGRMVLTGSRAGVSPSAGLSAYAASKAALHAAVQSASEEWKRQGITVNAVLPGTINTPANRAAMPGANMDEWVSPDSIASMMLWLCSDAGAGVTGALIPLYGRS